MNPKYIVSLELAKQLKDCGVPQESEWYWEMTLLPDEKGNPSDKANESSAHLTTKENKYLCSGDKWLIWVSAFHVGELMEELLLRKQILWFYHNANTYITRNETTQKEIDEENLPEALGRHLLEIYEQDTGVTNKINSIERDV